jgi:peroxiredoxin (alkyl hydroperoxide reductase subunit C)
LKVGCARPAGGPTGETTTDQTADDSNTKREDEMMMQVGKKAPDFIAQGYQNGF